MVLRNCKGEWIPNVENMEAMSKHIADMVCVLRELQEAMGSLLGEVDLSDFDYENEECKRVLEASGKFMPNGIREPEQVQEVQPQEPKHSQGHWQAFGDKVFCGSETIINASLGNNLSQAEREANVRLIAAAPDLLEALKAILSRYKAVGGCCEKIIKDAEAAIAKAIDPVL
jgi:hypothetical protein